MAKVKIAKLNKNKNITKEMVSQIGEFLYHSEGVKSLFMRVNFDDGSTIGFRRNSTDDKIDAWDLEVDDDD